MYCDAYCPDEDADDDDDSGIDECDDVECDCFTLSITLSHVTLVHKMTTVYVHHILQCNSYSLVFIIYDAGGGGGGDCCSC